MDLKLLLFCTFIIASVATCFCIEPVVSKIPYKKPVHAKEKLYSKIKKYDSFHIQTTTDSSVTIDPNEDEDLNSSTPCSESSSIYSDEKNSFEKNSIEDISTIANVKITTSSPLDSSCTCGIFLGSQFLKGSSNPPKGDPVISSVLERSFTCNRVGQKQCLTKCLQQIVQHLPNSANILCASLDRDIHKEKAFLFVRNCNNKWHNTNLTAGREYCCRNGLSYNCPTK